MRCFRVEPPDIEGNCLWVHGDVWVSCVMRRSPLIADSELIIKSLSSVRTIIANVNSVVKCQIALWRNVWSPLDQRLHKIPDRFVRCLSSSSPHLIRTLLCLQMCARLHHHELNECDREMLCIKISILIMIFSEFIVSFECHRTINRRSETCTWAHTHATFKCHFHPRCLFVRPMHRSSVNGVSVMEC